MKVHLIDGTYELFRHHYALPPEVNQDGQQVSAVAGVVGSILGMLERGATHVAVATDHVIQSFRNDLWPGYKDAVRVVGGRAAWPRSGGVGDGGTRSG